MSEFSQYSKVGRMDIGGKKEQVGIGEITDQGDHISVETLGGCSRAALEQTMHEIANQAKKVVKAKFQGQEISVEPEQTPEA